MTEGVKFTIEQSVVLDIGSGPHPKPDATDRMDMHQWAGVTKVHDLRHIPYPYEDNYADKIYLGDVIEHLTTFDAPKVLKEIHRILKPGGRFEITTPDVKWIMERIVFNDWNEKANVDWLRQHENPWDNAMDYLFGGWRHPEEYKIPGMGHINGFDEYTLTQTMIAAGFKNVKRVPDDRNPAPAQDAILKLVATK